MISGIQTIIPHSLRPLVAPAYRKVRKSLNKVHRIVDRRTLDEDGLRRLLNNAGLQPGAVVMLHSSMDELVRRVPHLNSIQFIRLIFEMVGPDGTILMPTFPFRGKQRIYIENHETFDVRTAPSQVGLITEVFRRMPGVIRSLHPTHPISAWGRHAQALTGTHHLGGAFDEQSPLYRLTQHSGIVVGVGTSLRESFTILHVPEEIHPVARERFFEQEIRTMTVVNGNERFTYNFRALRPDVDRNYDRVEKELIRAGVLRVFKAGGLSCLMTNADDFVRRSMALIDRGRYL
jgi:aminoglycoside 3-N-acetyltransferase